MEKRREKVPVDDIDAYTLEMEQVRHFDIRPRVRGKGLGHRLLWMTLIFAH